MRRGKGRVPFPSSLIFEPSTKAFAPFTIITFLNCFQSQGVILNNLLMYKSYKNNNMAEDNIPQANQVAIRQMIIDIRGVKVILDRDIAKLYGVTTGNLNKAVKRNIERFPERFMFQLTEEENLLFQNGISSWGGTRTLHYAFTEQGVAMLSSVLHSPTAIQVSISIIDAFVALRALVADNQLLRSEIKNTPRPKIGFKRNDED